MTQCKRKWRSTVVIRYVLCVMLLLVTDGCALSLVVGGEERASFDANFHVSMLNVLEISVAST